jgi:hypothetical protein
MDLFSATTPAVIPAPSLPLADFDKALLGQSLILTRCQPRAKEYDVARVHDIPPQE